MTQEDEQIAQRRAHLAAIEALGLPAYPHRFNPADTISALVDAHEPKTSEELNASRIETVDRGRILAIRSFGRPASWCSRTGGRIQVVLPAGLAVRARLTICQAARLR